MKSIMRIISFTGSFRKWYVFMSVFIVLISLLSLAVPLLNKQLIDIIVNRISGGEADFRRFIMILVLIAATDFASSFLTAFSQWIGDILTVRLRTYLSQKFYSHVLSLHMGYFDNEITGSIVNRLYRGIESITDFIQNMLNNFLPFFMTAVVTIALLSFYSPFIGILLIILFPAYIIISHGSSMDWMKYETQKNAINDMSQGRVFESLTGIRIVKSFAMELTELKNFISSRKKMENLTVVQTKRWHFYDFLRRIALNVILFAILAYIMYWTFMGRYTIGEMALLIQLANQARFPLFAMSFILGQIQQASSGSEDFFRVINTRSQITDRQGSRDLKPNKNGEPVIRFENVFFGYSDKNVLKDINFFLKQGEKLALVGSSGEGKSTIVNLILRYYEAKKGDILINGQNVLDVTQKSLHEHIAVVFQESLLFSGTIEDNIKYGKPGSSRREIESAAKAANAHDFISKLPEGYKSLVGERGVKLSGGQKQRIAIARAILKDAPIIILDEATSSLDSKSELAVQKGLDNLLSGRTSIIIAHRLSTIANADYILVIQGGRIAEYGTAKDLMMKEKGVYRQLVDLQKTLLSSPSPEKSRELEKFDLVG